VTSNLILASQSPRRRELLAQAGFAFSVEAADIDESRLADEAPEAYVRRLALEKARVIAARRPGATVVGSDTTVVLDGAVLNKPQDVEDARRMLLALAGRAHAVHTGVAVGGGGGGRSPVETTRVFFEPMLPDELEAYLLTGDSLDKAGAYGIQGYAARWVSRIEGDFFNVMGLPIAATVRLLREVGLR